MYVCLYATKSARCAMTELSLIDQCVNAIVIYVLPRVRPWFTVVTKASSVAHSLKLSNVDLG